MNRGRRAIFDGYKEVLSFRRRLKHFAHKLPRCTMKAEMI